MAEQAVRRAEAPQAAGARSAAARARRRGAPAHLGNIRRRAERRHAGGAALGQEGALLLFKPALRSSG